MLKKLTVPNLFRLKYFFSLILILAVNKNLSAQCPPNIDFELGTFTNWQCSTGTFLNGAITMSPTLPLPGLHDMFTTPPGNGLDLYGLFPKNCPNGSGHSIKIGNETTGRNADRVSYTVNIPAGQNTYNLLYHYAVVLNDNSHPAADQPRLLIDVLNITDGTPLPCPFDPIVVTGNLPGFILSSTPGSGGAPVYYKDWAANSMKLDNLAGKTIEISFTVTGCGVSNGSHFGYVYLDFNSSCSSAFDGAIYCPDDSFIDVTAPFGYNSYRWWNITDPTTILGTSQVINFTPPPPSGTVLQVELTPFPGYGCPDVLTAYLWDTLTVYANAGVDRLSCQNAPVQLGIAPTPGRVYSWSPVTGLSNPNISNPIATPSNTTTYVLTVTNAGGGCLTTDTVEVKAAVLDNTITRTGLDIYCLGDPQGAVLTVAPADSIQWYLGGSPIPGANQTTYTVLQTGNYHATVFSFQGCNLTTLDEFITVYAQPSAGFTPNAPGSIEQCFNGHVFDFTNTSVIGTGTMSYLWEMGDGTTFNSTDVLGYSYAVPGIYTVKLTVTSDNGCVDSMLQQVKVKVSPVAGFDKDPEKQCFKDNQFIFTSTSTVATGDLLYRWNMGDGNYISSTDVIYSYANPGTYNVKLLVFSDEGCVDSTDFDIMVNPMPVVGFTVNSAQQCMFNNSFDFTNTSSIAWGNLNYLWSFGDGITATQRDVSHSYAQPGNYTVNLLVTSDEGCSVASSSFAVGIYAVPAAGFLVTQPACVNNPLQLINTTQTNNPSPLNYLWDFDNGQTAVIRNPIYAYTARGVYTISLSVSTAQCPTSFSTLKKLVNIDNPAPGIRYADKEAIFNFPTTLNARQIGSSVLWTPATNLNNRASYSPTFRGVTDQLYQIEHKNASGCITVDTLFVKAIKKIKIYVPTAFTPGNSTGVNDYLRPLLFGFDKVNYFRIYNRWGKMLFQMQSDRPGWDGRVNGQLIDPGTYVWMIEAVDVDGVVHKEQGTTILLK